MPDSRKLAAADENTLISLARFSGLLGSQEDYRVDRSAANPRSSRKVERKVCVQFFP